MLQEAPNKESCAECVILTTEPQLLIAMVKIQQTPQYIGIFKGGQHACHAPLVLAKNLSCSERALWSLFAKLKTVGSLPKCIKQCVISQQV